MKFTATVALGVAAIFLSSMQAHALVGPSKSGDAFSPYVVMVLKRTQSRAGFCSGVVVARDVVLTAAHCVTGAADIRILPSSGGQTDLLEVATVQTHPEFRPNAPRTRERSIDLALVRMKSPLPPQLSAAPRHNGETITIGTRFRIAGFGIAVEGNERSAGKLREGELAARAPLSSILLWANDPSGKGFGACTGDSGGPVFANDSATLVAITAWASGSGKRQCGLLTQATLVAPQAKWIDRVLATWGAR